MRLRVFIVLSSLALCTQAFAQSGYWYQGQFVKLSRMPTSRFYVQSWDSNQVSDADLKEIIAFGNCRCVSEVRPNAYIIEGNDVRAISGLYVSELYQSADADEIIVLPRICLRIQSGIDIDKLLKRHNIPVVNQI